MDFTLLIFGEAERIFGDKATATAWLSQPRQALEGHSALAIAVDQDGVDRVLEILLRLEHGFCT